MGTRCPGGHVLNDDYGERPVEYIDGGIVGYCKNCNDRVEIPKMEGGLAVAWVKALCAQILTADGHEPELMGDLSDAVEQLKADKQAVDIALNTVEMVKGVLAHRLRMEVDG